MWEFTLLFCCFWHLISLCKIFGGLLRVKYKPGRWLCWWRLLTRGRNCNVSVKCVIVLYWCVSIISCGICVIHHRNTCRIVRYLRGILIETLACCHDREQPDKVFAHWSHCAKEPPCLTGDKHGTYSGSMPLCFI